MHQPADRVGLYPTHLQIGALDDLGNAQIVVAFEQHADDGSLARTFTLAASANDSDGNPRIVTSDPDQRLDAGRIGDQGASALLSLNDAALSTVSNPDAPATIGLSTQNVRLFLGGFRFAEWQVTFETAVDPFNIDGQWA